MKKINLLILILACSACSTISSKEVPEIQGRTFSHELLNNVLSTHVTNGKVDYDKLQTNDAELEQYYSLLTKYSPDSTPDYFPNDDDKLAYWINAYNGSVLRTVLKHYPISSVKDVKPPFLFSYLPDISLSLIHI